MYRIILILGLIIALFYPYAAVPNTQKEKPVKFQKKRYTGKHISLNFQAISLRAVLQLLAEFTGINIVVSDKVAGTITLHLNDIPWDQALDIILSSHALSKQIIGDVMYITPTASLNNVRMPNGLKPRRILNESASLRSTLLQINYAKAADIAALLRDKNAKHMSAWGRLSVDTRTNTIWVQESRIRLEKIKEFVKKIDTPIKQVLIEARIVNVTKDVSQDLGLRFGVSSSSHVSGTIKGANQLVQKKAIMDGISLADRLNLDLAAAPISASPASIGIALAKLGHGILLDLELSALESEGQGEVISSPRLIATNQQAAVIESGEEIPYQEATSSGATSVAFRKAVLSLKVIPQITPDSKILMELKINQDTLSTQVFNGVPSILTKEIQTNVLVDNGQTVVLGGIYKQDRNKKINRVPFFGALPIVGVLFRNQSIAIRNEELLIFITPRIITNNEGQMFTEDVEKDKFGKYAGINLPKAILKRATLNQTLN